MQQIHQQRIASVRNALAGQELEAFMVSIEENRYYLSGFTGEDTQFDESAGVLLLTATQLILATDSRYEEQARKQAAGFEVVRYQKGIEAVLPDLLKRLGVLRLGFESARLSHKVHAACSEALEKENCSAELIPTEDIVENFRRIKSEEEIRCTVDALRLAETAFREVLEGIRPGLTEKEVAWKMEKTMREAGAQGLSFPVIVASGPNSALPHAVPSDRRLQRGEPVLIDWGARLAKYCSDTTRTLVLGKPDDRFTTVYTTVVAARDAATAAIREGASGTAIDSVAREIIREKGFAGKFGHGLGHGTGLAVHEAPRLSPVRDDQLESGMIVTVEPGIYLPGWGGVRMENQVVVRHDGAQILNDPTPFDPVVVV